MLPRERIPNECIPHKGKGNFKNESEKKNCIKEMKHKFIFSFERLPIQFSLMHQQQDDDYRNKTDVFELNE